MAYVEPKTIIRLCKGVPLDTSYKNTIWFKSRPDQIAYFNEKTKHTLQEHSFQRVNRGRVRVQVIMDNLLDCNYMAFQNSQFGNAKWYYAFILSVEYVNNETSEITYVIDEFQTWMFDELGHRGIVLGSCFVEREHVNNDTVGNHTVAENFEIGEYILGAEQIRNFKCGIGVYVLPPEKDGEIDYNTSIINRVPTPLLTRGFAPNPQEGYNDYHEFDIFMKSFASVPEKIAQIVSVPVDCIQNNSLSPITYSETVNRKTPFSYKGKTHSVKNKKLLTYPYCFLTVDNFCGQSEIYRWEDFGSDGTANFTIRGIVTPKPALEIYPNQYKGLESARGYGIVFDDFPVIPFLSDNYAIWSSQATPKALISVGSTIATTAIGVGVGLASGSAGVAGMSAIGGLTALQQYNQNVRANTAQYQTQIGAIGQASTGVVNTASEIGNYLVDREYHKLHSDSLASPISGSGLNMNEDRIGFRFNCYSIRPEYADIIDSFFTKYGYRVNENKVPNTEGRQYFNYVKTKDCIVISNIPTDSKIIIENCFNHGITLWHTTNVGNFDYNTENPIVTN